MYLRPAGFFAIAKEGRAKRIGICIESRRAVHFDLRFRFRLAFNFCFFRIRCAHMHRDFFFGDFCGLRSRRNF